MRCVVAGGLLGWTMAANGCVSAPQWQGPLPVRNQHPAQLTVQHMPPASASVLPTGATQARLDAAYSSLFLLGQGNGRSWLMDGEYLRVGPSVRVGLGAGLEAAVELPFAHTSGGFLDSFIIDYHDTFALPDQSRDTTEKNDFSIGATRQGQVVWTVERDSAELMDVPLQLTCQIVEPGAHRLGFAVRGGVELPTGDDERGYGSGGVDATVGGLLDYRLGTVALYGHAQHTFATTPASARRSGLEFADITAFGLAAELPLKNWLHALVQVEWENSTLREFGLPVTGRDQTMLWIGGRADMGRGVAIEVGFGEDLQGLASPDFTAWLAWVWNPGSSRGPGPSQLPR